jgi:TPR repeat protein
VANAQAALEAFKAQLDQSEKTYKMQKQLFDEKVISRNEFNLSESNFKSAQANYNAAKQGIKGGQASVQIAQSNLAFLYENGQGVIKDLVEAYSFFYISSQDKDLAPFAKECTRLEKILTTSGLKDAQKRIKELQREIDAHKANIWNFNAFIEIQNKAESGDPEAQYSLAQNYENGQKHDFKSNFADCLKWYRLSAIQGYSKSQLVLGGFFKNGFGVPRDIVEAYAFYDVAGNFLDDARSEKKKLKELMTPLQIEAGKKRSKELQVEIETKIIEKKKAEKNNSYGS